MLSQLGHLPRFVRLVLILTFVVVIPTIYLLYPTPERLPSPGEYQAGGIDSDHWREPITPDYLVKEQVREWDDELPLGGSRTQKDGSVVLGGLSDETVHGGVIMPKLGNETAKAELGRSAWKVLHLMTLRYPDEPTEDDRQALKSFFHLFSRLYPCGECATEFQALLKEYPPQTGSRKSASLWLCHVHNQVNERLGKPEFDCLTLDETYDCGCGDETGTATSGPIPEETATGRSSSSGNDEDERGLKEELVFKQDQGGDAMSKDMTAGGAESEIDFDGLNGNGNRHKGLKWHEQGVADERPLRQGTEIGPHQLVKPEPNAAYEVDDSEGTTEDEDLHYEYDKAQAQNEEQHEE
ncbi:uncharacterized protein I303_108279 [Kwoniella dejecticola CBS 10117]|uniref:Sulfhydryl oxidase n=1 Tax=Kwoniella dejecticola CBS 10117 TaxID=1296121 RepID=A0A1A5ZXU8_9TREE|nr:uncharacterized protein I303_07394 [Kwoniella dejecticola CBS 10117]OBR82632.1 hypothetical protein I303_07394 [Kwoniella dejecticola CBS 10117]